jgi:sodium-dependent dicarboxylate transporter 2/3/5
VSAPIGSEEPVPVVVSRVGGVVALALFFLIWFWPGETGMEPHAQRLAAVAALMAVCWMTQAMPIEVTSLLPLALFPLCGIQSAKSVAASYFSDSSFLYMGGFIVALGIERWRLHKRMALRIVSALGVGTRRIVLGMMLATFVISMWISNTASTLLMLPIGLALLDSLAEWHERTDDKDAAFAHLSMATTLGIGYAATIGGMATLVGTPTNLVYVDVFRRLYPEGPAISAGQWMTIWTPFAAVFLFLAWALLTWGSRSPKWTVPLDKQMFHKQLAGLGRMQAGERWMAGLFGFIVAAWLFRTDFVFGNVVLLPGWGHIANAWLERLGVPEASRNDWISDTTVAMAVAALMFIIPVRNPRDGARMTLMDWPTASRLPWGVLLLFGGGFALADACRVTGLAEWCGQRLAVAVEGQPLWVTILAVCVLVTFLSELTSNVATANALLPMIAGTAVALGYDPRLLMIPAGIAASCGFMLPVSTPPHTIVFGTGRIRLSQMMRYGVVLNVVSSAMIVLATYWLLVPQTGIALDQAPVWANNP